MKLHLKRKKLGTFSKIIFLRKKKKTRVNLPQFPELIKNNYQKPKPKIIPNDKT